MAENNDNIKQLVAAERNPAAIQRHDSSPMLDETAMAKELLL